MYRTHQRKTWNMFGISMVYSATWETHAIYNIYDICEMHESINNLTHIYIYICIHNYITSFLESYMYHVEIDSTIVPMPTTTLLIDKSLPGGSLWGCSSGGGGERTGFATLWFGIPLGSSNGWGMVRARWFRERSEWKERIKWYVHLLREVLLNISWVVSYFCTL